MIFCIWCPIQIENLEVWTMCDLMRQICDAVMFLHQNKLLHTNITSHAVHIVSPHVAKLANFEYMIEK